MPKSKSSNARNSDERQSTNSTPIFNWAKNQLGHLLVDSSQIGFAESRGSLAAFRADVSFEQRVRMVYEIGKSEVLQTAGPAQGQANLMKIIGPVPSLTRFNLLLGKAESPQDVELDAHRPPKIIFRRESPGSTAVRRLVIRQSVIAAIGSTSSSRLLGLQESTDLRFSDLKVTA